MADLIEMDLAKNEVTFKDHTKVNYKDFEAKWNQHWIGLIAGETMTHSDVERFMKRGSSKNMEQLLQGKKMEGKLEVLIGKKMDTSAIMKFILIMLFISVFAVVGWFILTKMHIL